MGWDRSCDRVAMLFDITLWNDDGCDDCDVDNDVRDVDDDDRDVDDVDDDVGDTTAR